MIGSDCYQCWYFIAVKITDTNTTSYRLTVSQVDDSSGRFKELRVSTTREIFLAAGFTERIKFLLDSSNSFVLNGQVATGDIQMFVSLDPDTVGASNFLWKA